MNSVCQYNRTYYTEFGTKSLCQINSDDLDRLSKNELLLFSYNQCILYWYYEILNNQSISC